MMRFSDCFYKVTSLWTKGNGLQWLGFKHIQTLCGCNVSDVIVFGRICRSQILPSALIRVLITTVIACASPRAMAPIVCFVIGSSNADIFCNPHKTISLKPYIFFKQIHLRIPLQDISVCMQEMYLKSLVRFYGSFCLSNRSPLSEFFRNYDDLGPVSI